MRIVILGNSGSGKSTMARHLIQTSGVPLLCLDEIAWEQGTHRRPIDESIRSLHQFIENNNEWIIEGCYGDLVEAALPFCTELRFLNPGVEVCVEHCRRRQWEPEKFPSQEAQQAMLTHLVEWVRQYETRDDEFGLKYHRRIFTQFKGPKKEYLSLSSYKDA
jgi:adenylate kinase family enzyme